MSSSFWKPVCSFLRVLEPLLQVMSDLLCTHLLKWWKWDVPFAGRFLYDDMKMSEWQFRQWSLQVGFHFWKAKPEISLHVKWFFGTPWAVARQAPLSMGFSRQEQWSGLPFPPPGDLPAPGIEPTSLTSPAIDRRVLYHKRHLGSRIFILGCMCTYFL